MGMVKKFDVFFCEIRGNEKTHSRAACQVYELITHGECGIMPHSLPDKWALIGHFREI